MFIISYNCGGFNDIKARYINSLLSDCDVLLCVEHWLLNNKLYMFGRCSHGFNVFGTCGINETKLLLGRRYGGCCIYINNKFNCSSRLLDCACERIRAVLSVFNDFSILFVAVYMPGDMLSNIDEVNFVLSSIHALHQLYWPDHVIYGGDWNADFSRSHSQHTIALSQFCVEEHFIHVYSRKKSVEYTYLSYINCSKSLIDHFFISAQLDNCVNKLCVINA